MSVRYPPVQRGELKELVVEEFSRLGRNVGDVINTLDWLESHEVNVVVRNIGLQSRPQGKKNPIWSLISSVMSSLYQMEKENILERTRTGRMVAVQRGKKMGRPTGTVESPREFLNKPRNREIIGYLNRGLSYSEIARLMDCSKNTVCKVKALMQQLDSPLNA
jgi:DNA invertase Pin-like site-specific DNA recombinase